MKFQIVNTCSIFVQLFFYLINVIDTAVKGKKVFLLVLDGFIYDYYKYTDLPNINQLVQSGVRAERLIPSFPSNTWPAMTTLNTGLYTESHGIVNNIFKDEELNKTFHLTDDPKDYENNGRFFTQEPLWLTNQKQGGTLFHL